MNNKDLKGEIVDDNSVTKYVDEFGNELDPSLIDENGNYKGVTEYVDEFGNPIDPSLIDENGNYIGEQSNIISASEHQMDNKEMLDGMVTFDYNNVPITDIVNSIILDAIAKGASDIHFDPFDGGIKIRLRVDGVLNDYSIVPLYVKKNMITRIKIISGMNITESRVPQDGAIRSEIDGKTIDIRVSSLPTNLGEKIVLRIMDYSMSAAGIEALDFNKQNLEKVKKMLALPNGIILVTGATGTGKSTTVYSMLQKLNVEGTNLITVEDPIEMSIPGINQVQAQAEIGLTFANVLRSILRQDPDVIMIGEIRDDETARIAVRASITGHLVLSTIHTNNSLNTIERLTDMSVERYLLGSSLSGIVSQKLARRLCEKCKTKRPATDYEKEIFKRALNIDVKEIYEPVGCSECNHGYRGRIAIHEVLLLNQEIKDAIVKGASKPYLRNLVYGKDGTETMLQDGLEKVLEGKTSFNEILKLIDLDDDLGNDTQLGLNDQINASQIVSNPTTLNSNQPININITEDVLKSLNMLSKELTPSVEENKQIEVKEETPIEQETITQEEPVIENAPVEENITNTETEESKNLPIVKDDTNSIPIVLPSKEEPEKIIKLSTYEELEKLDDEKYDITKKLYNDRLNVLLKQIDVSKLADQNEIDNYLIYLSLIEDDSLLYKNNNKLIKDIINELNESSDYIMESDDIDLTDDIELPELNHEPEKITLTQKDIDIDDLNIIDINNLVNKKDILESDLNTNNDDFDKLKDVKTLINDENDKNIYISENDLNFDNDLNIINTEDKKDNIIKEEDNNDILKDAYFDDLIDDATIDSLLNDINLEEE